LEQTKLEQTQQQGDAVPHACCAGMCECRATACAARSDGQSVPSTADEPSCCLRVLGSCSVL
jgi:hypothetical protein